MQKWIHYKFLVLLFCLPLISFGQETLSVKKIKVEGNEEVQSREILKQLNTSEVKLKNRLLFWKELDAFSPLMLRNDRERLVRFYQRKGFLNVVVKTTVDTLKNNKYVIVHIKIDENKPVKIKSVEVYFQDSVTNELQQKVKNGIVLSEGQIFEDEAIFTAERTIKDYFKDNGYPFVRIDRNINLQPEGATIKFNVYAGQKSYFGAVTIEGDSLVGKSFIVNKLKFQTDELYSRQLIQESQDQLFNTELFQFVVIRSVKDSVSENRVPVQIYLKELPPWHLKAQAGYGTDDKVRVSVELTKLQFFGGARKIKFKAKRSFYYPISTEIEFLQPDVLNKKIDFIVNPYLTIENEPSYSAMRYGSNLTVQKRFKNYTRINSTLFYEQVNLTQTNDEDTLNQPDIYNKSGLELGGSLNRTNDLFDPTQGYRLSGKFTFMGLEPSSAYYYYKMEVGGVKYFDLGKQWVLATKLKMGVMEPILSAEKTPIEDRFMIGGANSLRGWPRHGISPVNSDNEPIGGNTLMETGIEVRFPIYKIIHGAVFTDAGNVWRTAYDYNFSAFHYDAGIGLRIKTPIGPARIDFATPILNDNPTLQLFITVGHAF